MLILSRKIGESIIIGNGEVVLTVLNRNQYGEIRLGFEAIPEISIHREEIYNKIIQDRKTKGDENGD
jgi:carbon storage regulator